MACKPLHSLFVGAVLCGFVFAPACAQDNGTAPATNPAPAPTAEAPAIPGAGQPGMPLSEIDRILQDEQLRIDLQESFQRKSRLRAPDVDPAQLSTLLFTLWQHELLQEAKARFKTRPPGPGETPAGAEGEKPQGPREISLGGIVFVASNEWTVWLNKVRITPDAIPKEVMDISVTKNYIELKWFDAYTNLIFPVRLRPHQRFNLDNRIFLPGEGTQ
jgi:hypothetical protein